jgi:hypothetical protein
MTATITDYHLLDSEFNLKSAPTSRKFVICNDNVFIPHARSSAGGTFKYPWFDAETRKAGGFFVVVGKEKYDRDKGRPGMPQAALKHGGMKYKTTKGTIVRGEEILYGYYCKITKCPSNASF